MSDNENNPWAPDRHEEPEDGGTDEAGDAGGTGWPGARVTTITGPDPDSLAPLLLMVAPPARQSRWTVLVRVVLAIPHFFVVWAIGIAAEVILVIGWFGALFTGRLPDFAADFLTGYLRWQTRVMGYALLLTGSYPPFTLEDADYPVRIAVRPGKLNRLAVLFRFFLLIPAGLVNWAVSFGVAIVGFVTWLIVLIRGEMPRSLHLAIAVVMRYQTRLYGFELMLTSAQPGGLYGDEARSEEDLITEEPESQAWKMVLTSGARNLVTLFLVLGALAAIAYVAVIAVVVANAGSAIDKVTNQNASTSVQADFALVNNALAAYQSKAQACNQQLSCLTALDRSESPPLTTFANQIQAVPVSGSAVSDARNTLVGAVTRSASAFSSLGSATTPDVYNARLAEVQQALNQLGVDYANVGKALQKNS
jgi:hypothetical protein